MGSSSNTLDIQSLMVNNPQMVETVKTLQAANGNYEAVFYNAAKQKGFSESEAKDILSALQQSWSSL